MIEALVHPPLVLGQVSAAAGERRGVRDAGEEEGEENGDEASARRPHLLQPSHRLRSTRRETFLSGPPFLCLFAVPNRGPCWAGLQERRRPIAHAAYWLELCAKAEWVPKTSVFLFIFTWEYLLKYSVAIYYY